MRAIKSRLMNLKPGKLGGLNYTQPAIPAKAGIATKSWGPSEDGQAFLQESCAVVQPGTTLQVEQQHIIKNYLMKSLSY